MKKGGINNTFKKIIYQSTEMVFLADDSSPYWIFYSNSAFDEQIGNKLEEKSLANLGLDISSYLYKEELIIPFDGKYYSFNIELPDEYTDYFLFYNGREVGVKGLPDQKESQIILGGSKDIIAIGHEYFFTWINEAAKDILGYEPEDLINLDLCPYLHPEEKDTVLRVWNELKGKESDHTKLVHRFLAKDKTYKWLEWSIQYQEEKYYAIGRDITEKQLSQSRLLFQKDVLDHVPEMIIVANASGEIIQTNEKAERCFQFNISQNTAHRLIGLSSVFEDRENWVKNRDKLKIQQEVAFRTTCLNAKKNSFPAEICLRLGKDSDHIIAVVRDISEMVQNETSIHHAGEFLKQLTNQVPGALFQLVLDQKGKMSFSYVSSGARELFGADEEVWKKLNDFDFLLSKVHPKDVGNILMSTVNSARRLTPWNCQFRIKDKEKGITKWVQGSAMPDELPTGEVNWYGYLFDITEMKRFQKKLEKAKDIAESASKVKSDFISMVSHEIRTPLNAISGSVYSLLSEDHPKYQDSALNTINFAIENLIIMINDLLDFQKIEADKMVLDRKPFNLKQLLTQVVNGLKYQAQESKNTLNLVVSDRLDLEIVGDKVRLSQILNNLITNALKFTNEGRVDVTATFMQDLGDKVVAYFEVKDTGIGIAKENFDKVFNDFDQVSNTFNKKYGGTGLGMSITKKLLRKMNSEIKLESEVGVGSTFYFDLHLDKALVETMPSIKEVAAVSNEIQPSQVRVLLAEDNDVNAIVVSKIMKRWGYECDRVSNGKEAVDAMESKAYDLILMDIQMPVMDGFMAAEIIKKKHDVPIIALTAASKSEVFEKIEKSGMERFLSKPIDAIELHQNITELLSSQNHLS